MVFQWVDNLWQRTRDFQSFTESGWKFFATFPQRRNKDIDSYCVSGASCSTCSAQMDLTITTVTVRPMFQTTTWHTARDESDRLHRYYHSDLDYGFSEKHSLLILAVWTHHCASGIKQQQFAALCRVTRHLPQQPPLRYGIGRWRGSVLSAALLDLTSGASRPSLSIRCTGGKGAQRTQRVTPTEHFTDENDVW